MLAVKFVVSSPKAPPDELPRCCYCMLLQCVMAAAVCGRHLVSSPKAPPDEPPLCCYCTLLQGVSVA